MLQKISAVAIILSIYTFGNCTRVQCHCAKRQHPKPFSGSRMLSEKWMRLFPSNQENTILGTQSSQGLIITLFAIRGTFDLDNLAVMDQPVENRRDTGSSGKDLRPLGKGQVRCQNNWRFFIATRDNLKEHVGGFVLIRQIAEFMCAKQSLV